MNSTKQPLRVLRSRCHFPMTSHFLSACFLEKLCGSTVFQFPENCCLLSLSSVPLSLIMEDVMTIQVRNTYLFTQIVFCNIWNDFWYSSFHTLKAYIPVQDFPCIYMDRVLNYDGSMVQMINTFVDSESHLD